jgi:hypothetical protein
MTDRPHLANLREPFSPSLAKVGAFVLTVILVSLFMHPLQFGMTQLLEGYWGTWKLPITLSAIQVNRYRSYIRNLNSLTQEHQDAYLRAAGINADSDSDLSDEDQIILEAMLHGEEGDRLMRHVIGKEEAVRKLTQFPERARRVMPTRLGNALRRFEDMAGRPYKINGFATAPHFSLVAKPEHWRYVEDEQQQLDTTLRLCVVSIIATIESVAFLATDGQWLFLALVPYVLAYVSYRGSVAAARSYGRAVMTAIDLSRFALYDSLNVRRPASLEEERKLNETLMAVLQGKRAPLRYRLEPETSSMRDA